MITGLDLVCSTEDSDTPQKYTVGGTDKAKVACTVGTHSSTFGCCCCSSLTKSRPTSCQALHITKLSNFPYVNPRALQEV